MKKNNKRKILSGALVVGALGLVAGILLAPQTGKKLRSGIHKTFANFYRFIAPQLKKLKSMGDKEYKAFIRKAVAAYSKAKRLSVAETKELLRYAESYWKNIKKHF